MSGWARRDVLAGSAALALVGPVRARAAGDPAEAAFLAAYPIFEMARLAAGPRGGINLVRHAVKLSDHTSRTVTCPNNDTLYSSYWFDLSGGPIDVDLPLDTERYLSLEIMSAFTDNVAVISAANTARVPHRLRIVGPSHRNAHADGRRVIHVPTSDGWMLGRTGVDGPTDIAAAALVQHRIAFTPVPGNTLIVPRKIVPVSADDPANLFAVVAETLSRSDPRDPLVRHARTVAHAPRAMADWIQAVARARASMATGLSRRARMVNGWSWPNAAIGQFGDDDLFRAATALSGIGALIDSEAVYLTATSDAAGQSLDSGGSYRLTLPAAGIPAKGFWSLTMYEREPDGRLFLIDNPIARYSIGNRTPGLVRNADGTTTILLQPDQPTSGPANWLPAPRGPFRLMLRLYWPDMAVQRRRWSPPAVVRA
jgi:hypothetical protein